MGLPGFVVFPSVYTAPLFRRDAMPFVLDSARFFRTSKFRRQAVYILARCLCILALTLGIFVLSAKPTHAATLPVGFAETLVASGLASPTAMDFAPDGRLFVSQQSGALRVIKNGVLLPTPFVTIAADTFNEHGLLGVAFDPNFMLNGYVYVYYTAATPTVHNRVSRFTAHATVAAPGSELV